MISCVLTDILWIKKILRKTFVIQEVQANEPSELWVHRNSFWYRAKLDTKKQTVRYFKSKFDIIYKMYNLKIKF